MSEDLGESRSFRWDRSKDPGDEILGFSGEWDLFRELVNVVTDFTRERNEESLERARSYFLESKRELCLPVNVLDVFRLEGRFTDQEGIEDDTDTPDVYFERVTSFRVKENLGCDVVWCPADSPVNPIVNQPLSR